MGFIVHDRPYDLHLYRHTGEEPLCSARYGTGQCDCIIGGSNSDGHPAMKELQRRVLRLGLLSNDLF